MSTFLVDTSPLFDYLYIVYRRSEETGRWEALNHIRAEPQYRHFVQFVNTHGPLQTVSGVIAELSGVLMRKSGRALFGPKGFWMRIWPLLAGDAPQVLDATVSLKALNIEVVSAVGPVDASLLTRAISLRAEERDVHVITGDEEFYKRYQQVVPMIWIDEILYPGPV